LDLDESDESEYSDSEYRRKLLKLKKRDTKSIELIEEEKNEFKDK
jgi:hypothetical protein